MPNGGTLNGSALQQKPHPYSSEKEFMDAYTTLHTTFQSGITKNLAWRKWQLKQVWWMIVDNEDAICRSLHADLNRHDFESYSSDIVGIKQDVIKHIQYLEKWAADVVPDAGFLFTTMGKARIRKEPLGVALIIGAWNFPFLLLWQPMIAAIAAGNCVMIKPSEVSPASERLIAELIPRYLDPYAIRCITAGPAETQRMLEEKFNHIFFTGSAHVAKFVSIAAAKHLTPLVLELGGQGPAIVTKSANLDIAAKRIALVKWLNAGQICLTINHVFAEPEIYDELATKIAAWFEVYMREDKYCKIINEKNWSRLVGFLGETNGRIVYGGKSEKEKGWIEPTIVTDVNLKGGFLIP
jgi:aldehyde dehydrogenase (NAD+)